MALENIFFTVRAGFSASIECLISDTASSPTWLGSNVIPTPTGDPNPVSAGPDVTGATEVLSNSIPLPEGWDIEDIDIFQLFQCLPDSDVPSTHVSSFSAPSVLPLDNLRISIKFKVGTVIDFQVFPYSLEPTVVEFTPLVRTIAYTPTYWLDPAPGSYNSTGYTLSYSYINGRVLDAGSLTHTGYDLVSTPSPYRVTALTGQFYATEPGVLYKPMIHVSALSLSSYDNEYQSVNGVTDGTKWAFSSAYSTTIDGMSFWRVPRFSLNAARYFTSAGAYSLTSRWTDSRNYRKPGTDYGYEVALKTYPADNPDIQTLWAFAADASNPDMLLEPNLTFQSSTAYIEHVFIRNMYICVGFSGYANQSPLEMEWRHPTRLEPDTWYWITFEVYQGRGNIAINGEFAPVDFKGITNDYQKWQFAVGNNQNGTNGFDGYAFDWLWYFGNKRRHQNFSSPSPWTATVADDTSRPNWAEAIAYTANGLPEPVTFTVI